MDGGATEWLAAKLLSAVVSHAAPALKDLILGPEFERALASATASALRGTIKGNLTDASEEQVDQVSDLLDRYWPSLDLLPEGTGSLLDAVEDMVSRALETAAIPIDMGDGYAPTSTLDVIADDTGVVLDPAGFSREFAARFTRTVTMTAIAGGALKGLADQLNSDLTHRALKQPPRAAELYPAFTVLEDVRLFGGMVMDDLAVSFVNHGDLTATQVSFHLLGRAAYLGQKPFFEGDSRNVGEATTIPPGHGTTFRAVYELGQRAHSLQMVAAGAVRGVDLGIPGDEPLEVEITPTYQDGVSSEPRTGPTARARLTWTRDGLRLPMLYRTQVLDPDGPVE